MTDRTSSSLTSKAISINTSSSTNVMPETNISFCFRTVRSGVATVKSFRKITLFIVIFQMQKQHKGKRRVISGDVFFPAILNIRIRNDMITPEKEYVYKCPACSTLHKRPEGYHKCPKCSCILIRMNPNYITK